MTELEQPSDKSYTIAVCLSGIFGVVGIQHFYLERWGEGALDFGLFVATLYFLFTGHVGLAIITGIVDFLHTLFVTIMLLTGSFRDGDGNRVMYPGQKY